MQRLLFYLVFFTHQITNAQFAPPAGMAGSTAISAEDNRFVFWANYCKISRGFQCIDSLNKGKTTVGDSTSALGKAMQNGVVSLGDEGEAILSFPYEISNKPGVDFAVFENSFEDSFLELATVSVSSDGINYVQFPCVSNTQTQKQISSFGKIGAGQINNLAGKYRVGYGTPFDLNELKDSAKININKIVFVKIKDVVGKINVTGTKDKNGNFINDPFPTPFPSGGFDLDAVGVISSNFLTQKSVNKNSQLFYPNPVKMDGNIYTNSKLKCIDLYSATGKKYSLKFDNNCAKLTNISAGIYFVHIDKMVFKIIIN